MRSASPWDFRGSDEIAMSDLFETKGYIINQANNAYLELMKQEIEKSFFSFIFEKNMPTVSLENAHHVISHDESNSLRMHIMQYLSQGTAFNKYYYLAARDVIHALCGNELAMQKRPGISINLPQNSKDILPIHADTWNGVSPFELNIWVPFVDCDDSMSLYILERSAYEEKLKSSAGLLRLSSDKLFTELKSELTWIPIKYGEILAFDQSLPHGYSLNRQSKTHWSFNCRFKGIHTPYWDKKLGEYFIPITVKSSTRLGMNYKHPENWL